MNLPKVCEKFLTQLTLDYKSENTIRSYRYDLIHFIKYLNIEGINESYFDILTSQDLTDYVATLVQVEKRDASTVARKIACLKSFYNYMNEKGFVKNNPASEIRQPKVKRKLPKYLNEQELDELLDVAELGTESRNAERDYAIMAILVHTGIRRFEVSNIDISDIKGDRILIRGKGNKERYVGINDECIDAIEEYLKVKKLADGDALFVSEQGNRINPNTVGKIAKKYLTEIQKGNMSTHKIRHSSASKWLNNGINLKAIQLLLGHENISTTDIYTHVCNDTTITAMNQLGSKRKDKNNL